MTNASTATASPLADLRPHVAVVRSTREEKAFTFALGAVLVLAAARIAIGRALPMDHETTDLIDAVHAVEGLTLLLSSYFVAGRGWTRASFTIRATGLGYLFSLGVGPLVRQVYWFGRSFPIADDALASADRFLGFDWQAYVSLFQNHPVAVHVLWVAYETIFKQPFVIGVFLAYKRMPERLYAFVVAQDVCIALVSLVTVFLPAYGAYHYFGASPSSMPFIPGGDMDTMALPIKAVRAGFLEMGTTSALVQFPSYHAAACVMFCWAAWPTKLRYPILAMNFLMLASAPIFGCHYVCDMLAGMALAVVAITVAKRVVMRPCPTPPQAVPVAAGPVPVGVAA